MPARLMSLFGMLVLSMFTLTVGIASASAQTVDRVEAAAIESDPRYAELFAKIRESESDEAMLSTSIALLEYVASTYPMDSNLFLHVLDQSWNIANYLDLEMRHTALLRQLYIEAFPAAATRLGPDHALVQVMRQHRNSYLNGAGMLEDLPPGFFSFTPRPPDFSTLPAAPPTRVLAAEREALAQDRQFAELFRAYETARVEWTDDARWLSSTIALWDHVEQAYPADSEIYLRTLDAAAVAVLTTDYQNAYAARMLSALEPAVPLVNAQQGFNSELAKSLGQALAIFTEDAERLSNEGQNESEFHWRFLGYPDEVRSQLIAFAEQRKGLSGDALIDNLVRTRELEAEAIGEFDPYALYAGTRDILVGMTNAARFIEAADIAHEWLDYYIADDRLEFAENDLSGSDMAVTVSSYLAFSLAQLGESERGAAALRRVLANPQGSGPPPEYLYPNQPGSDPVEPEHYLPQAHAQLARVLLRSNQDPEEALASANFAIRYLRGVRDNRPPGADADEVIASEFAKPEGRAFGQDAREQFSAFVEASWQVQKKGGGEHAELLSQAFTAAQDALLDKTTRAVARTAAQQFAERAGFSELAAERKAITEQIAKQGNSNWANAEFRRLLSRQEDIDFELQRKAPEFFKLIRPRALELDEARALLAPEEALLLILPTEYGTHVLVVTQDGEAWHRSDLTARELVFKSRVLREDLDPWGSGISDVWDGGFDASVAHEIYAELIAPIMPTLSGVSALLYTPGPALSSIPFSVLLQDPSPTPDARQHEFRSMKWLGDRFALAQLPSLASLSFLRGHNAPESTITMIGFGDPLLNGEAAVRGGRNASAIGTGRIGNLLSSIPDDAANGVLADPESIRALARLPGTAREVEAVAAVLKQGSNTIHLQGDATERMVRKERLSNTRYILFATHGLMAGESGIASEPGLVFTPPDTASMSDDGLLTASEILLLDLSADWVILSACNTAASDGLGGGGLSGLARSFFYAGARSLLASHWPVRDDIAPLITTHAIAMLEKDPDISRAEALASAMAAVRNERSIDFSDHPSSWAPFITIGDLR